MVDDVSNAFQFEIEWGVFVAIIQDEQLLLDGKIVKGLGKGPIRSDAVEVSDDLDALFAEICARDPQRKISTSVAVLRLSKEGFCSHLVDLGWFEVVFQTPPTSIGVNVIVVALMGSGDR